MSATDRRPRGPEAPTICDDRREEPTLAELLDGPMGRPEPALPAGGCLIAECIDERHPTLQGRVRVRFIDPAGDEQDPWVPTCHGLAVRVRDRVLMVHPGNSDEWIVTGVIDGFAARPRVEPQPVAALELRSDEALHIVSSAGEPLVEILQQRDGPTVRLLRPDVRVELAGKLAVSAESIEFEAARGQVKIKASDDVVVQGEVVRLN